MSQMLADIRRIVNEDVSNRITQYDVIYEAITNAIHANATKIICTFDSLDNLLKEDEVDLIERKVDSISVWDNGDGLNERNYSSFCKYRTEFKIDLGCKGVGRFIFLKTFKNITYVSHLVKEQEERTFKFDFDFDTDNIQISPKIIKSNSTEISLSEPSLHYLYPERAIDRRIDLDIHIIREKVLVHLIPTLFFYKKKLQRNIQIKFVDKRNNKTAIIKEKDIPEFFSQKFNVIGRDSIRFEFILHYQIKNEPGQLNAYYCANNRTVCEFSDKDFKIAFPRGYSGYLLLESDY
ncbi:MAG: ATP-binding protein, partial [Panacibacter sp.]